jgi:signal transduction histidine kinase
VLHLLPFVFIASIDSASFERWTKFTGIAGVSGRSFDLVLFGTAATVVFALIAQIGEQVDFLRFLPARGTPGKRAWWAAYLAAGPGWIIPGMLKLLAGSFLAFLAVEHFVPLPKAVEPTRMYLVAFGYVFSSPQMALAFTGAFVVISQLKINVTNAYAGSIAWSNFFSRLTHSHAGRVVWLVFNVTIALMLMELGIFKMLEHALGLYSIVAVSWVSALVADLVINKPLGLSPAGIEFKRAYLYDINPVGVGAMFAATVVGIAAFCGFLGTTLQSLSSFLALAVAFVMAPLIAWATQGRFYIARSPRQNWNGQEVIGCSICEHHFEAEDMAHCPAYSGAICSLCCSLETRCRDCCKPQARVSNQLLAWFGEALPERVVTLLNTHVGRYLGVLSLFVGVIGAVLSLVYFLIALDMEGPREVLISTLWTVFFILIIIAGVAAWLLVLAQESRRVAEEETRRQTDLLMNEIEAHKRTDAKLQKAKEVAEAASTAKSRHVVGLSHELRTPLNAILGYAQLLERDPAIPKPRLNAIRVVRRSAEHLSGLIDGLLDISKIEAGRFHLSRNEVQLSDFLNEIVAMFRLQATAKGIEFRHVRTGRLPVVIQTDDNRLRQILINLLSNAIKFTDAGHVTFRVRYHLFWQRSPCVRPSGLKSSFPACFRRPHCLPVSRWQWPVARPCNWARRRLRRRKTPCRLPPPGITAPMRAGTWTSTASNIAPIQPISKRPCATPRRSAAPGNARKPSPCSKRLRSKIRATRRCLARTAARWPKPETTNKLWKCSTARIRRTSPIGTSCRRRVPYSIRWVATPTRSATI